MAFRPNWYDNDKRGSVFGRSIQDWSAIRLIFTVCGAVFALQLALFMGGGRTGLSWVEELFGLRSWTLSPDGLSFNFLFPVQWFTYMVLHSPSDIFHILGNLFYLWLFGRELEATMGKSAFLRMFVVGGLVGGILQWAYNLYTGDVWPTIGASGAVYTVMMLYACRWPRRVIWMLIPFPIPLPVVLLMVFRVLSDLGGLADGGGNVAHLVHLGGAAVGVLWFRKGDVVRQLQTKHQRQKSVKVAESQSTDRREMDRILGKIQASGLASLDKQERGFLEQRSRELRKSR